MKNKEKPRKSTTPKTTSKFAGLQLWIVQSSITLLIILGVLMLRVVNVGVFEQFATYFYRVMMVEDEVVSDKTAAVSLRTPQVFSRYTAVNPALSFSSVKSKEVSPPLTNGVLTSPYGYRQDPMGGSGNGYHHDGIDIAADEGTPLLAFMSGEVSEVGYEENGYGKYLIVRCQNNSEYVYAHCSEITCSVGEYVEAGEMVARVGNTGRSTGSHLHFEWREEGGAVNPETMLPKETYA